MGYSGVTGFAILLVMAAITDIRSYTIPNWLTAGVLLAFAVSLFGSPLDLPHLERHLAAAASMLLVGFLLFYLNLFGGGDAKLIAAAALWTGFAALPRFLLVMSISGGVLALAILIYRRLRSSDSEKLDRRMPYGVAIAMAGLDFCWHQINIAL